jgi:hypothetical protein
MLPFVTSVAVSGIVQFLALLHDSLYCKDNSANTLKLDLSMGDLPYRVAMNLMFLIS